MIKRKMKSSRRPILLITLTSLFSTFLVWLPFFLRLKSFWRIPLPTEGMATIMKNFDGLYYLVIAKTLYHPQAITTLASFSLPAIYYAAHFPLYPLLIKVGGILINPLWSMLAVTVIASVLAALVFYQLLKEFKLSREPLWLTVIFLLFPARWLVVRSVGSPEPLFILFILSSFYFFKKRQYWPAGILGALAQLTKPPGILLFLAYGLYLLWEKRQQLSKNWPLQLIKVIREAWPLFLIPLTLGILFTYYHFIYGDFWAYFHSGDNIHLFWPPFQVFNSTLTWVGTFWLEEIIYLYLLGFLGVVFLFQQKKEDLAVFAGLFFSTILFVAHRDISRYSLPLVPFLLIAFDQFLTSREFKIAFGVILLPIFLYAINFIAGNTLAVADWTPFL